MEQGAETNRPYYLAVAELRRRAQSPSEPGVGLAEFELRVASQNGEDGVIAEIRRRIGPASSPFFVEFGVERGVEGNCVALADVFGWDGVFIEADVDDYARLEAKYKAVPRIRTLQSFVTPQNVLDLFRSADVPKDLELLAIDIDGGDYWVWRALTDYEPRIVVIEYNPELPANERLVVPSDYSGWDGSDYFGASIGALAALGDSKGYRLVHTDLTGANAFFVRRDLPGDWPDEPELRGPNSFLLGMRHPADMLDRPFVRDPPV